MIAESGCNSVNCICGEICGGVQRIDEEEGCAEEKAGRFCDHGLETVGDCLADGEAFRCFFDNGTVCVKNTVRISTLVCLFCAISEKSHRSIIVISGHVSAPAEAALTTSTPSRKPRSRVFHVGATVGAGTTFGDGAGGVGRATGRSETVAMAKEASCAMASRVILIRRMRDRRVTKIPRRGA